MQQQFETQEREKRFTSQEYGEVVRRAERIRQEREGSLSREALAESAAEIGIREEDLREAERQLQAERELQTQKRRTVRTVGGASAAVLALTLMFGYNGLNSQRLAVVQARSNLQSVLQRRADALPNLSRIAERGAAHELKLNEELSRVRSGLQSNDLRTQMEAHQEANRLLESAADKTEGLTSEIYRDLMAEVAGSENRVSVARERYNAAATRYNGAAQSFPMVLVRPLVGMPKEMPVFEVRGNLEQPPKL